MGRKLKRKDVPFESVRLIDFLIFVPKEHNNTYGLMGEDLERLREIQNRWSEEERERKSMYDNGEVDVQRINVDPVRKDRMHKDGD